MSASNILYKKHKIFIPFDIESAKIHKYNSFFLNKSNSSSKKNINKHGIITKIISLPKSYTLNQNRRSHTLDIEHNKNIYVKKRIKFNNDLSIFSKIDNDNISEINNKTISQHFYNDSLFADNSQTFYTPISIAKNKKYINHSDCSLLTHSNNKDIKNNKCESDLNNYIKNRNKNSIKYYKNFFKNKDSNTKSRNEYNYYIYNSVLSTCDNNKNISVNNISKLENKKNLPFKLNYNYDYITKLLYNK